MIDIAALLYEICGDDAVFQPGVDLVETGLLDSLAMIELFFQLEDVYGLELQPTRIDRTRLRTVPGIESLVREALEGR